MARKWLAAAISSKREAKLYQSASMAGGEEAMKLSYPAKCWRKRRVGGEIVCIWRRRKTIWRSVVAAKTTAAKRKKMVASAWRHGERKPIRHGGGISVAACMARRRRNDVIWRPSINRRPGSWRRGGGGINTAGESGIESGGGSA